MGTKILGQEPQPAVETVVLHTDTNENILSMNVPDKKIIVDGEAGMSVLRTLVDKSWEAGRDLVFKGTNITFRRGE